MDLKPAKISVLDDKTLEVKDVEWTDALPDIFWTTPSDFSLGIKVTINIVLMPTLIALLVLLPVLPI